MAASPLFTGMPEIAPLKAKLARGLETKYALIDAASVFRSVSVTSCHVGGGGQSVAWSRWSGAVVKRKGAAAWLQAAKSSAASAGTITGKSYSARAILRLLQV